MGLISTAFLRCASSQAAGTKFWPKDQIVMDLLNCFFSVCPDGDAMHLHLTYQKCQRVPEPV